jgi:hypothetical protein
MGCHQEKIRVKKLFDYCFIIIDARAPGMGKEDTIGGDID